MSPEFVTLLRKGLAQMGNDQTALRRVLGLSKNRISNALAGRGYPFGLLNCLKLARLIGEPDWVVLRAAGPGAGKPAIADLLEQSYGRRGDRPRPLVPDPLSGLSPVQRKHVLQLVRDLKRRTR